MDFMIGATCWHVIGHSADPWVPAELLCKTRANPDYLHHGSAVDVVLSEMPVCRNCDRMTGGEASRYVQGVREGAA